MKKLPSRIMLSVAGLASAFAGLAAFVVHQSARATPTASETAHPGAVFADGCRAPTNSVHHAYYVDPLRGKASNDGSASSPWNNLQNVLVTKKFILRGGDIIYLMSGNHGAIRIVDSVNSDFITIQAAPGQRPLLTALTIRGGQNWIIKGVKIQSLGSNALLDVGTSNVGIASKNIMFVGNEISSSDDVSGWSKADWVAKASHGINIDGRPDIVDIDSPIVNGERASHHATTCITVSDNVITHVKTAATFEADRSHFDNNTIDDYADDAVDFGGNFLTLSRNKISNVNDIADDIHDDGFQGFLPNGTGYNAASFSNVVIDHNVIVRQTNPQLNYPTAMQGIDNFDGGGHRDWYNLKVTNNIAILNIWNCISFGGVHDSVIANNICLADGVKTISQLGSGATIKAPGDVAQISVTDYNHFSKKSSNVLVSNNIATAVDGTQATDRTVVFKNNVVSAILAFYENGKPGWYSLAGAYNDPSGNKNIIDPRLTKYFVDVRSATTRYGPMRVYTPVWKPRSPYANLGPR